MFNYKQIFTNIYPLMILFNIKTLRLRRTILYPIPYESQYPIRLWRLLCIELYCSLHEDGCEHINKLALWWCIIIDYIFQLSQHGSIRRRGFISDPGSRRKTKGFKEAKISRYELENTSKYGMLWKHFSCRFITQFITLMRCSSSVTWGCPIKITRIWKTWFWSTSHNRVKLEDFNSRRR